MQAALAGGDADAIANIAAEVSVGDPVGAFIAACTEAVQAARQLWGDDTEAVLAERALRQIDLPNTTDTSSARNDRLVVCRPAGLPWTVQGLVQRL